MLSLKYGIITSVSWPLMQFHELISLSHYELMTTLTDQLEVTANIRNI